MFCADYVAAFVYHAMFTVGTVHLVRQRKTSSEEEYSDHGLVRFTTLALGLHQQREEAKTKEQPWLPVTVAVGAGLVSGLAASITLFPFDFVRASAVSSTTSEISKKLYLKLVLGESWSKKDPLRWLDSSLCGGSVWGLLCRQATGQHSFTGKMNSI